eukprot:355642-Chlamydomonas_euryale.AAC.2
MHILKPNTFRGLRVPVSSPPNPPASRLLHSPHPSATLAGTRRLRAPRAPLWPHAAWPGDHADGARHR